jgi:protein-tyrosine phosphatase
VKRFPILAVCTANICRSPMMEVLLRDQLDPDRFEIASAGVWGWDAAPVDSMVVLELARLGHSVSDFRSRPLRLHHVEEAALVLTAAREHRAEVLALSPQALRKTFTLREFAALVPGSEVTTLEDLVADAARRRSTAPVDIDVQDPYRREPDVHRRVADQIAGAVDVVADKLSTLTSKSRVPRPQ